MHWLWPGADLWWSGAWASVLMPSLLSGWALYKHRQQLRAGWLALLLISLAGSVLSGQWRLTEETVSLHLVPVAFIALCFLAYFQVLLPPPALAFATVFLSLLPADLWHAYSHLYRPSGQLSHFVGIGGAGLLDGLFFFPAMATLLVFYVRYRSTAPGTARRLKVR
jgi:uncharacterized membrane protein